MADIWSSKMTILKEPLEEQINCLIDLREELIQCHSDNISNDIKILLEWAIKNVEKRLLDLGHSLKGLKGYEALPNM